MVMRRICIRTHDIRILTGRGEKYSRELYKKLKQHFRKEDHQFVTFREFCTYTGIPYKEMDTFFKNNRP